MTNSKKQYTDQAGFDYWACPECEMWVGEDRDDCVVCGYDRGEEHE